MGPARQKLLNVSGNTALHHTFSAVSVQKKPKQCNELLGTDQILAHSGALTRDFMVTLSASVTK